MTALAGVFLRDERPVDRERLTAVADSLRPFGAGTPVLWRGGPAGLVKATSVATTPQDPFDSQPMELHDGRILLFDGFLNHREDLTAALGTSPAAAGRTSDGALFARALEQWGDAAAVRAEGWFTAVLWDPDARVLKAVCSPVMAPPLHFTIDSRRVVVATAPRGIFAWGDLPRRLDDAHFASSLILDYGAPRATFYQGVSSLSPGEMLTVGPRRNEVERYYDLAERARPVRLRKDADYVAAAGELLHHAVRSALRAPETPAVMMSGGLDSTSIAVTALGLLEGCSGALPLISFTAGPDPEWDGRAPTGRTGDERDAVRALVRMHPGLDARFVEAADWSGAGWQMRMFELAEFPSRNPGNGYWTHECLRQAAAAGRRVVLRGVGGGHTLSRSGYGRLSEAFRTGRWHTLWRESAGLPRGRLGRLSPLLRHAVFPNLPEGMHRVFKVALGDRGWRGYSPIHPDYARSARVEERAREHGFDPWFKRHPSGRQAALDSLSGPLLRNARAAKRAQEAIHGVAIRDPLLERRLVEWCCGLPYDQLLCGGRTKVLLRRLMQDRLPAEILDGPKGLQAADWHLRNSRRLPEIRMTLERWREDPAVAGRLDLDRLLRAVETWPERTPLSARDHPDRLLLHFLGRALQAGRFIKWVEGGGNWAAT